MTSNAKYQICEYLSIPLDIYNWIRAHLALYMIFSGIYLEYHLIGHEIVVCKNRWSLVTARFNYSILKCGSICHASNKIALLSSIIMVSARPCFTINLNIDRKFFTSL